MNKYKRNFVKANDLKSSHFTRYTYKDPFKNRQPYTPSKVDDTYHYVGYNSLWDFLLEVVFSVGYDVMFKITRR